MSVQGLPVGGLTTVGQIVATNTLTFDAGQEGLAIAVALPASSAFMTSNSLMKPRYSPLSSTTGAPAV